MKFFNFTDRGITEVKNMDSKRNTLLYVSAGSTLLFSSMFFALYVVPFLFIPQLVDALSFIQNSILFFIISTLACVSSFVWYDEFIFKKNAKKNRREIYLGTVIDKKVTIGRKGMMRYYLYMGFNKFRVCEEEYNLFEVGDAAEFQVTPNGQYLYTVTPSAIFFPLKNEAEEVLVSATDETEVNC